MIIGHRTIISTENETLKRKQTGIEAFFGGSNKKKTHDIRDNIEQPKTSQTQKRTLNITTAERWKTASLAKYNPEEWLTLKKDSGLVTAMVCVTCARYKQRVISMKGFAPQWSSDEGSKRLQHSALEHVMSKPHKVSFYLNVKQKGLNLLERDNIIHGSTDSALSENEAIFIVYFEPKHPESDYMKINVTFVRLVFLKSTDANGVIESIETALKSIGIGNMYAKLVRFRSDGASMNRGKKEGVKAILQQTNPWLSFGWCAAQHLELALNDALNATSFKDVDEVIIRLYYLYKQSPKKIRQLK